MAERDTGRTAKTPDGWGTAFGGPLGRRRPRLPTLPEYVRPLRRLGLAGKKFDPPTYQERLAAVLGISIENAWLSAGDHPLLHAKLVRGGDAGLLLRGKRSENAIIVIPDTLPYSQRIKTWYHELEHIARGHALASRDTYALEHRSLTTILEGRAQATSIQEEGAAGGEVWVPTRSLLSRPPVEDLEFCNAEAELCADYALTVGARGPEIYESESYLFSRRL